MAETHTTGLLKIGHGGMPGDSGFSLVSNNTEALAVVVAECWPYIKSEGHRKEVVGNGHRLLACWNALDGLDPAALPGLLEERRELLEACKRLRSRLDIRMGEYDAVYDDDHPDMQAMQLASAAIQKAER